MSLTDDPNYPWMRLEPPRWTRSRALQITIGCLLVPLRLALFITCVVLYWVVTRIAIAGYPQDTPLTGARRKILKLGRFFARGTVFALGFHTIKYNGPRPNFDEETMLPYVIVSNHISYCDILFHMSQDYFPAFISKDQVRTMPLVGAIASAMSCLFVDRLKKDNTTMELSRRYFSGKTAYPPIIIFPEGTTTNGRALTQFRKGAFLGGIPVTPIVLKYSYTTTNPSDVGSSPGEHILWMMMELSNHLEVTFLPPYNPTEEEREDPVLYANNVRQKMASIGGFPTFDVDYTHKIAYSKPKAN